MIALPVPTAVRGIVVCGVADQRTYAADDLVLANGWRSTERDGTAVWRWTKGRGVLPVDTADGPLIVEVLVAATTTYRMEAPLRAAA